MASGVAEIIKDKALIILVVLTLVGLALRIYSIDHYSLWLDEIATHYFSNIDYFTSLRIESNSPTYYHIENWMEAILGKNETALRMLSAISGALCIPLVYPISKSLYNNQTVALFASFLVMISPLLIDYSQEARGYQLGTLFFLISLFLMIRSYDSDRLKPWILFACSSAASIHMHYAMLVPIALMVLYAAVDILIKNKYRLSQIIKDHHNKLISLLVTILLTTPLLYGLYISYWRVLKKEVWMSGWDFISDAIWQYFLSNPVCVVMVGAIFIIGVYVIITRRIALGGLLMLLSFVPFITYSLLSYNSPVSLRYILFIAPIIYIVASGALTLIPETKLDIKILQRKEQSCMGAKGLHLATIVMATIVLASTAPALADYYSGQDDNSWKDAVSAVEQEVDDDSLIIYSPGWFYWGCEGAIAFYADILETHNVELQPSDSIEEIISLLEGKERKTFIITYGHDVEKESWLLSSGFDCLSKGTIWVYCSNSEQ